MRFADYPTQEQDAIITKWLANRLFPFYATLTVAQCRPVFLAFNPELWHDTHHPERGEFIMMHDGNFLCQDLRKLYDR